MPAPHSRQVALNGSTISHLMSLGAGRPTSRRRRKARALPPVRRPSPLAEIVDSLIRDESGDTDRMAELAVTWVLQNPVPVPLTKPSSCRSRRPTVPRCASMPSGPEIAGVVEPARFPRLDLRFRNQRWAARIGVGTLSESGRPPAMGTAAVHRGYRRRLRRKTTMRSIMGAKAPRWPLPPQPYGSRKRRKWISPKAPRKRQGRHHRLGCVWTIAEHVRKHGPPASAPRVPASMLPVSSSLPEVGPLGSVPSAPGAPRTPAPRHRGAIAGSQDPATRDRPEAGVAAMPHRGGDPEPPYSRGRRIPRRPRPG